MEAKADAMLDIANATTDLISNSPSNQIDDLANKYEASPDAAVQDELEALKAKLGVAAEGGAPAEE